MLHQVRSAPPPLSWRVTVNGEPVAVLIDADNAAEAAAIVIGYCEGGEVIAVYDGSLFEGLWLAARVRDPGTGETRLTPVRLHKPEQTSEGGQ